MIVTYILMKLATNKKKQIIDSGTSDKETSAYLIFMNYSMCFISMWNS